MSSAIELCITDSEEFAKIDVKRTDGRRNRLPHHCKHWIPNVRRGGFACVPEFGNYLFSLCPEIGPQVSARRVHTKGAAGARGLVLDVKKTNSGGFLGG